MNTHSVTHRPAPSLPHTTPRPNEAGTLSDAEIRQIIRETLG
ncbi:hypothetical protein [Roseomonas indoligenes]|nr:hypothetical protein [Pararoseomonas indoligenes]